MVWWAGWIGGEDGLVVGWFGRTDGLMWMMVWWDLKWCEERIGGEGWFDGEDGLVGRIV